MQKVYFRDTLFLGFFILGFFSIGKAYKYNINIVIMWSGEIKYTTSLGLGSTKQYSYKAVLKAESLEIAHKAS